ncbi:MAG: HEAT repeat domain-containing protein [Gemmataceae bacterium]
MAASALGPIAGIDGEVGSTLIEVTKTDPDLWVREVAVEALGRAPFLQIRSALLSLLQRRPNSALRIATISLLEPGVASDQDVRSALLATLQNDCDVDVRLCAALSLVNSGGAIMPSVPSIMESSSALSIDDATIVRWLRTISNDRDWTSDPELWEFAPHLLLSLFRPAHIPALAHLRFYQRIQKSWLRRTGVPGNPEDLLPDAFQEFALCLLKPACQRFARRPEHYFKLPGLVRNLAIKSAESLLPFQERDFSGAIMEHPLPQGDFLSSREAMTMAGRNSDMSVVENAILRELTQKLHDYIYLKKSGIKQALLVQNLLKKVAYADLSAVLPGAKNLRRTLDTEVKVLLQELNLPNRNALELLADLLVQEFMVGVVPDTMKINKRE